MNPPQKLRFLEPAGSQLLNRDACLRGLFSESPFHIRRDGNRQRHHLPRLILLE
jgi:hypothetical protein